MDYLFDKKDLTLHESMGSVIKNGRKKYMYLPVWIEVDDDEEYYEATGFYKCKVHRLGNLPKELDGLIKQHWGI